MIKSLHKGWELKWIYWNDCSELFCISISYLVIMIFKIMGFFSSWIPFPSRLRWWIKLYITRISHALELWHCPHCSIRCKCHWTSCLLCKQRVGIFTCFDFLQLQVGVSEDMNSQLINQLHDISVNTLQEVFLWGVGLLESSQNFLHESHHVK